MPKVKFGSMTARFEIMKRDRWRCTYCRALMNAKENRGWTTLVVPVHLGGKREASNIVTACDACIRKRAAESSQPKIA